MTRPFATGFKLASAYIFWWLLWMVVQALILNKMGLTLEIAALDAAVSNVILATSGYAVITSLRFYQPRKILQYLLALSITLAFISVYAQQWMMHYLAGNQVEYVAFLNKSIYLRCAFDWLMISYISATSWLWFFVKDQKDEAVRTESMEKLAREAELSTLRMQLQPHFLFNSLNSISALVVSSPEHARTMIQQLSDFLRGTVRKDDLQLVTLAEELQHLQLYLDIEKIRFGHRLSTVVTTDEASQQAKMPSLLLQPIVENAIKFGLYDTLGDITITINAHLKNEVLVIIITNPFDDSSTGQPRQGTGFGLNSVHRRLYLLYAQNDLLLTAKRDSTFTTIVKIPQV